MHIERRCRPIPSSYLGCKWVMRRNNQMALSRGRQLRSEKRVPLDGRFPSQHADVLNMKQ